MVAIDANDYTTLKEEIGDMLLHVIMLSILLKEKSEFGLEQIIETITNKMVMRHPHVFGKGKARTAKQVLGKWEKIKHKERRGKGKSLLSGVPESLPALYRAENIQKRAARVGFDWDKVAGAWEKVHEELDEVNEILNSKLKTQKSKVQLKSQKLEEEIGDLLFAVTNVARKLNINAEQALQRSNIKFIRRFGLIEKELLRKKLTLKQMDRLWDQAKKVV
jgi:MazG family protein